MSKSPSYLGEFFRHPYNRVAISVAVCAAIFASIPYGGTGLVLVGVVALGAEVLAALGVPDLPAFRAWVDREKQNKERAARRVRLLEELKGYGDANALASYEQMCSRVSALYQTAGDSSTTLTRQDVEKLDDLTVDFLGLCIVNLSLTQRKDYANEDVVMKRIASIQTQLQNKVMSGEEERQLNAALAEYTDAAHRSRRLAIRCSALEATLVAMPDKMEEVYQLVMASPYSAEMGSKLEDSLSRLRIAEEVAAEFDSSDELTLDSKMPLVGALAATAVNAKQQAARQTARALKV